MLHTIEGNMDTFAKIRCSPTPFVAQCLTKRRRRPDSDVRRRHPACISHASAATASPAYGMVWAHRQDFLDGWI